MTMQANPNAVLPARRLDFVPPGSQVTVTIGRNVESTPMSGNDWTDFQSLVTQALRDLFAPTASFGPFDGTGEWEGVREDSSVQIVISHYPASVSAVAGRLGKLAHYFGQDAIAWSFGPNLLATP